MPSASDLTRRGRHTGRRIADAAVGTAARRPGVARIVPLGALLMATAGGVGSLALPDDGGRAAAGTTDHSEDTDPERPLSGPRVVSTDAVVAPAGFVTVASRSHRAAGAVPAAAVEAAGPSTAGRHRADAGDTGAGTKTRPAAQPSAQAGVGPHPATTSTPAPATTPATAPVETAAPTPARPAAPATGPIGSVVGTLTGTLSDTPSGTIDGTAGGLLGVTAGR